MEVEMKSSKVDNEIKAGVFGVVRSHSEKPKRTILKEIKKKFPHLSSKDIAKILSDLSD